MFWEPRFCSTTPSSRDTAIGVTKAHCKMQNLTRGTYGESGVRDVTQNVVNDTLKKKRT